MSWFRLDDKSWSHAKVIAVGNAAWGALCRLGAYSSDHLTDGKIPSSIAQLITTIDETETLVKHGLLHRSEDGSYEIHDYLRYNPRAREVRKLREERAKAGARGAAKTNGKRSARPAAIAAANTGTLPGLGREHVDGKTSPRPDPVPIPPPSKKPESAARAKSERPDGQVWRIFKAAYASAHGRDYVRDAARDGKAAQAISKAVDEHATNVEAREALLTFWCDRYHAIEGDSWLANEGFPLHAMARALPRIGLPPTTPAPRDPEPRADVVTDPEELERIRKEALEAVDLATKKRTPFLSNDPPEATS